MKLRNKISLGYSVVLTLIVLVGGWGIVNLRRLGQASEAILEENYQSILAAENMIDAIERQDSAILLLLLKDQQQGVEQFRNNEIVFLQWLGRAKDNITISGEKQTLEQLEKEYQNYLAATDKIKQENFNQTPISTADYYETVFPPFQEVRETCIELRELNQETMVSASNRAQTVSQQAIWSMAIAGTTAAGVGLALSLLLARFLALPLKKMTEATSQIASGDYDIRINVDTKDELGILAAEIASMSQKLKEFRELNVGRVIAEQKRNEAIIQSISDGLIVTDSDLKIIAINPVAATLTNTSPKLAINNHFLDICDRKELYQYLKEAAQSGKKLEIADSEKIVAIERNNSTHYYQFDITPVATAENKILGAVLLLQDVTKLKEIDRLKSEFVATASHELRTPLTGMAMSLNLLSETAETKLSGSEAELLQGAAEDVGRLQNLVNELLDLSKIESGRIEMEFAAVEVQLLLEKAIATLQVQLQEKNIAIAQPNCKDLPRVKVDPNKITWVLTNLIANAIRYTKVGGEIRVGAKLRKDWVDIFVADDGEGIPVEYQSKIFDKFIQVQTEKDTGGSGLGLAICKEIIQAHGGRIWVDSSPGQGSTFTFMVAISETEEQT